MSPKRALENVAHAAVLKNLKTVNVFSRSGSPDAVAIREMWGDNSMIKNKAGFLGKGG